MRILKPTVPYPSAEQLVIFARVPATFSRGHVGVSGAFEELSGLSGVGLFQAGGLTLERQGHARRVAAAGVDRNFFDALGLPPFAGTYFSNSSIEPVAVISHGLWNTTFNHAPDAIGETILLNHEPFRVVGIMMPRATFPNLTDVWIPPLADTQMTGFAYVPSGIARLPAGTVMSDLLRRLRTSTSRLPETIRFSTYLYGRGSFLLMVLIALCVLVGTCIAGNVIGIQLVELQRRVHELRIQYSLGLDLVRACSQAAMECGLLAAAGAFIGTVVAAVMGYALSVRTPDLPLPFADVSSGRFYVTVIAVSVIAWAAMAAIALAFCVRAARGHLLVPRAQSISVGHQGVVLLQVAMACVLMTLSGAFWLDARRLATIDLGMHENDAVLASLSLPVGVYSDGETVARLLSRIRDRVHAAARGAVFAASTLSPDVGTVAQAVPVSPNAGLAPTLAAAIPLRVFATPRLFEALGLPLIAGRSFADGDLALADEAVVVSRKVAEGLDPTSPARVVGARIRVENRPAVIIGVVSDVRMTGPHFPQYGQLYQLLGRQGQSAPREVTLVLKPGQAAQSAEAMLREAVTSIAPELPVYGDTTVGNLKRSFTRDERLAFVVATLLAVAASILSVMGLSGVLTLYMARRQRDIGIRLALGAGQAQLFTWVFGSLLSVVGLGIAFGAVLSVIGMTAMQSVTRIQSFHIIAVCMAVFVSGALAAIICLLHARSALKTSVLLLFR